VQVGFIGIGQMGYPMSRLLLEAGHELTIYDVRPDAAPDLVAKGARFAGSAAEVASTVDLVFTCLPNLEAVQEAIVSPTTGVIAHLRPGSGFIDFTSNSPELFPEIAKSCEAKGIEVLDCPVSGRPPDMTGMVGGPAATLEKYRTMLECVGCQRIFHLGGHGAGCVAKAVTQYMGYSAFVAALEGFLMAAKANIDLNMLADLVPVTAGRGANVGAVRAILKGDFEVSSSGFGTLEGVAKDMHLALELARHVGTPANIGLITSDVFDRADAQGWTMNAFPVSARILEAAAGIELRATPERVA
jgi:3-hydroxyisobutyrate dehydrogenase-like beta-hydroxyacid dehydrogenase